MFVLISIVILIAGLVLFLSPSSCIEFQRRFYEKINWRIEPISMEKEIRNTKIMGLFLIGATIAAIIYFLFKRY